MKSIGVFLGVGPSAGGMFQYAQSILEGLRPLQAEGCSITVACVDGHWQPFLAQLPYRTLMLRHGRFGLKLSALLMAARLPPRWTRAITATCNPLGSQLKQAGCEAWIFPAQDSLAYQVDVLAIATVHDLMHRYEPGFPEVSQGGRFAIREHRFRHLVTMSCAVLVDSTTGRQHVVESYGADPSKVHPLPYVAPEHILAPEPADFDQRYTLPRKFFFYPAQFWAHKNHARLLAATASLDTHCPDIEWVFTGGHRHGYEGLRETAKSLGLAQRVHFPGHVPDAYLSGFYRRARALVMPTFFGPTNIPPLEAFACDCPVAISNTYGMPEQAGGAALHFDPRSVDDIAAAIKRLWLDDGLCRELAGKGRTRAVAWNQVQFGAELCRILHEALLPDGKPLTP